MCDFEVIGSPSRLRFTRKTGALTRVYYNRIKKGESQGAKPRDIVEDFLASLVWEHLDFAKTKSSTEVWGNDHHENETGCD